MSDPPIDPGGFERLQAMFHSACKLPRQEQQDYIDDACDDGDLRRALQALLAADRAPSIALEIDADELTPARSPERGTERVGSYRILSRIREGGMGVVFLAEDTRLGRRVALKTIRRAWLDDDAVRQRFEREMAALAKLDHPRICKLFEVGEDNGLPFMAMQFIDGGDLGSLIAQARREERTTLTLPRATASSSSSRGADTRA